MNLTGKCPACGRPPKRSSDANRLLWSIYRQIAEQIRPKGEAYSAEAWHEYMKGLLLGAEDVVLPNGRVIVRPKSTSDLSKDEFADYMLALEAWAAEHGAEIVHE